MPRTLRTRAELEHEITVARAALILLEDADSDELSIREARARVDAALDSWAQRRDTA